MPLRSLADRPTADARHRSEAVMVDLTSRRAAADAAVRAAAHAPVRHLTAALLDALQGAWGTPEELLGTAPVRRLVALPS